MPEFEVVSASQKKTLDGRNGPMQVISLTLTADGRRHEAEWFTKAATAIPAAGSRIEGTLEPSDYGLKFKKAFGGGGGGGRPRDPKESAAIQRQHSQEMALRLLQIKATAGKLTPEVDLQPSKLKSLTDFFDDDIAAGVERKHPSQKMVNGLPVHNEPEPTSAPEPTTPSADYTQAGTVPTGDEGVPF